MAQRGKRDRGKERFWRRLLRQWRRSGRSVRGFCVEHGLAEPSFYAWRRVIAERDQEATPSSKQSGRGQADRCRVGREEPTDTTPVFVPVRVIDASAAAASASASVASVAPVELEVVLRRGCVVRVLRGCDADTLRQLLALLEEERPC